MERIELLRQKVKALYDAKYEGRAAWADWLADHHVFVVADNARKLAERYGANVDMAMAAAMLHDVADAVMGRKDPGRDEKEREIALTLLRETGFSDTEIEIIVDDAIRLHSCRGGAVPRTLEGKVMATADAQAHLMTDFYDFALEARGKEQSPEEARARTLPKVERDYYDKIFFEDARTEATPAYERVKALFAN